MVSFFVQMSTSFELRWQLFLFEVKSQPCYPFVRSCKADMLYFLLTLTIRLEPLCRRKWQFLGIESSGFKKRLKSFCGFLFENGMQFYRIQNVNFSVRIIFSYEKFEWAFRKKMLSCCKRFKDKTFLRFSRWWVRMYVVFHPDHMVRQDTCLIPVKMQ